MLELPAKRFPIAALALATLLGCPGCRRERPAAPRVPHPLSDGYVPFAPLLSTTTYLVDRAGHVVKTWESRFPPGVSVHLLPNGHLLRTGRPPVVPVFGGGGVGGHLEEIDWDGRVVWEWTLASERRVQHHDVTPLPNGHVLLLVWEARGREEALAAGRTPERVGAAGLWSECVVEVRPEPPRGGTVVWEWRLWDHLVQQVDARRAGYGRLSEHPERIDVNGGRAARSTTSEVLRRLKSLGYLASSALPSDVDADFAHANAVAYDPLLDRIVLTVNQYGEVWVLDHGTTALEAAGPSGGRAGRGGDLLYRWGNPAAYGRGRRGDQRLFGPHDARWIPDGYAGAGRLLVFSNGPSLSGNVSSVLEIEPPLTTDGGYVLEAGSPFGPDRPSWEYSGARERPFFAEFLSGAQRLPNGNTLITSGPEGKFFEVTPRGETVWEYRNPYSGDAPNPAGDPPFSVFRATFVPAGDPALSGRDLHPLRPQPPAPGRRSAGERHPAQETGSFSGTFIRYVCPSIFTVTRDVGGLAPSTTFASTIS